MNNQNINYKKNENNVIHQKFNYKFEKMDILKLFKICKNKKKIHKKKLKK